MIRGHCECGREHPDTLYLSMSTIGGDSPHLEGYHARVGSKAPWHEITDDLEQYEKEPSD